MIQKKSVKYLDFKLSYQVFGEGNQTVICLHGHGRSSDDFHFLAQNNLRVISIDVFFHGESLAPKSRITRNPISWSEIQPVFEKLFIEEKIAQCHVLAFSQGGRFALLLLEYLPERIQSFTLLAPDGLNNKSFYNWSSRRRFFRSLFIRWQKKPEKLQKLANTAVKLKMMRPKVRDFVHHFSSNPETMKRAANTWMAFRKLQPNPIKTGEIIRSFPIEFNIIMGKYDQVIRPIQAKIFLKNAGLPAEIIEIENGHDFFKPTSIEKFVDYLPFLKTEN
jgi:pimeloyl-ACP methyl ester carboxylesterase